MPMMYNRAATELDTWDIDAEEYKYAEYLENGTHAPSWLNRAYSILQILGIALFLSCPYTYSYILSLINNITLKCTWLLLGPVFTFLLSVYLYSKGERNHK